MPIPSEGQKELSPIRGATQRRAFVRMESCHWAQCQLRGVSCGCQQRTDHNRYITGLPLRGRPDLGQISWARLQDGCGSGEYDLSGVECMSPRRRADASRRRKTVWADRKKGCDPSTGLNSGRDNTLRTKFKSHLGKFTCEQGCSARNERRS